MPRTSCSEERWHFGLPRGHLQAVAPVFFFSGFGAGRGCPYSEFTLLQQAEDTGSSGFCPHLALGALAEATMRKSGHTGTLKGTEGLSHSPSLSTFSTLQPEQSLQLPVTPENTPVPPGTSVSLS